MVHLRAASRSRGAVGELQFDVMQSRLESEYNVVEAGMAWGKVKEQDFVGKEAHLRHRDEEPATVMCTLTVDDHTSASGVKRFPDARRAGMTDHPVCETRALSLRDRAAALEQPPAHARLARARDRLALLPDVPAADHWERCFLPRLRKRFGFCRQNAEP